MLYGIRSENDFRNFIEISTDMLGVQLRVEKHNSTRFDVPSVVNPEWHIVNLTEGLREGEDYNGWINHDTWLIHLYLTNESSLYESLKLIMSAHNQKDPTVTIVKLENLLLSFSLSSESRRCLCVALELTEYDKILSPRTVLREYLHSPQNKIVWAEILESLEEMTSEELRYKSSEKRYEVPVIYRTDVKGNQDE